MIDNLAPILPAHPVGALIAIGVSTAKPVALLPGVPPIGSVVTGYQASSWNALSAPAKTPHEIVDKLSVAANAILKKPDVIEKFRAVGSEPVGGHAGRRREILCRGARPLETRGRVAHLQKM